MMVSSNIKDNGLHKIGDIAKEIFSGLGSPKTKKRFKVAFAIERDWTKLVGAIAAKNVQFAGIRQDGTMMVLASTAAWMNEFSLLKLQVLKKVHRLPGGKMVKDIQIRAGERHRKVKPARVKKPPARRKLAKEERQKISRATETIADPHLRRAIERLYAKSLSGKRDGSRGGARDE